MIPSRKYTWSLVLIFVVVAALWTGISLAGWEPRQGLDLQGGISVVLAPKEGSNTESLEQAVNIIRNRVDALGVAEPEIALQGDNILVQLPGIKEQQRALELIGTTAQLRFRPVLESIPPGNEQYAGAGPGDCADPGTYPEDVPGEEIVLCAKPDGADVMPTDALKLRLGPVAVEGDELASAQAQIEQTTAQWYVNFDLTREGAQKFQEVTGQLACEPPGAPTRELAIVLDRVVESHPPMGEQVGCNEGIPGGSAQISGSFSEQEAKDLALVLRYGALPVELEPSATETVSPTLGRDSLRAGLVAGMIGVAIVFLYMLVFYRLLGLVVWLGILTHGAITLGVVVLLGELAGFALTLPGIAGLIVSLGIAADSFIVYFERVKDEARGGKTLRAATERGWASAKRTIVAADLVTALAAVVLYMLTVGGVRGFALMLGIATALDLVVSFFFMHPMVWALSRTRMLERSRALGLRAPVRRPAPVAGGQR